MNRTKKIVATLLASMLMSMNLLSVGSEVIAVAEELANQNSTTNHSNVEFNTYFEGKTYQKELEIGKEANINVSLEVKNSGYLTNGIVQFVNGNYQINSTNLTNEKVQSVSETQIQLAKVDSSDGKIIIQVPIAIKEQNKVIPNYFNQQTEVIFTGKYIDANGKEQSIQKSILTQAVWKSKAEAEVSTELTQLVPYQIGETYGVMLQTKINSQVKDNIIPVQNTNITVTVPAITMQEQAIKPSKVTVIANSTGATNGRKNGIEFNQNNYHYEAENNKVIINVENQEENGKIAWEKQAKDEYIVSCFYEGKAIYDFIKMSVNSAEKISGTIETSVTYKLYDELQKEIQKEIQTNYSLEKISANLNTYEINYTKEISKGYFYANEVKEEKLAKGEEIEEKQECIYELVYRAKITNSELVNNISFRSVPEKFEGQAEYVANAYTKEILIPGNIFNKMLGEEGKIEIFKTDNTKIAEITKETTKDEKDNYILDLSQQDANEIIIKTSKPVIEGEFAFKVTKGLKANQSITKEQMQDVNKMKLAVIASANDEQTLEAEIALKEPVTKAELNIDEGKQTLSTVVENKDIEMKVVLDTSNTDYALYKNPKFEIEMPSHIEKVTLKDVDLVLDDELKIKTAKVVTKNAKQVIEITLEGEQSQYFNNTVQTMQSKNVIAKGANIVIRADILVKKLTPTTTENMVLYYTNENTNLYEGNHTTKSPIKKAPQAVKTNTQVVAQGVTTASIQLVAPTGVMAATTLTEIDHQGTELLTNLTDENKQLIIPTYSEKKTVTVTGNIVNNQQNNIGNIVILGRIPSVGSTKIDSTETLASTFNTTLLSKIALSINPDNMVTVYYSENGAATKELQNTQNGWQTDPADLSKVKSYMIVQDPTLYDSQGAGQEFSYTIELPANLPYNQTATHMYKVYYDNDIEGATISQTKTAGMIEITTGEGPELKAELTSNMEYGNVDVVIIDEPIEQFHYLYDTATARCFATITNQGNIDAQNVTMKINLPNYTELVSYKEAKGSFETIENSLISLGNIKAGETKTVEYIIRANIAEAEPEGNRDPEAINQEYMVQRQMNISLKADNMENALTSNPFQFTILPGILKGFINQTNTLVDEIYSQTSTIQYRIHVNPMSDLENFKLIIPLPNDVTIQNAYWEEGETHSETGVTKGSNQVIASLATLPFEEKTFILEFTIGKNTESKFSTKTYAEAEGIEAKQVSNEQYIYKGTASFEGEQFTPNKTYVKEEEEFQYQFEINTSGTGAHKDFVFTDVLPNEVELTSTTVTIECPEGLDYQGTESRDYQNHQMKITIPYLPANSKVTITLMVNAKVSSVEENEKEIVNNASIQSDQVELTQLNSVKNYIEYNTKTHINPNTGTNEDNGNTPIPEQEGRYLIAGTAWVDYNQNGSREETEELLSGIKVLLIYKKNNQIVKDVNTGEEKIVITDDKGKYQFTNLVPDEYLVIFLYDAGKYSVTQYQKEGVSQSINSDAVNMKITLDGKKLYAGVSNTVRISNSNVREIDIGLYEAKKFDLRLDKYITKITRTTPTSGTKVYTYEKSQLAKIEILTRNVGKSNIIVEYKIVVTNEGQIPGYATKIIDYLPENMKFNTELNPTWYLSDNNRTVYNTSLAETKLQPGESKEVTLILSLNITENNIGTIVNNNAEIYESYNEQGVEDIDSTPANKLENEDDMSKADIVLSVVTGKIIGYTSISIVVILLLATGTYMIRKKVLPRKNK